MYLVCGFFLFLIVKQVLIGLFAELLAWLQSAGVTGIASAELQVCPRQSQQQQCFLHFGLTINAL